MNLMKTKRQKGYTVIELLIVTAISTIVLSAIGTVIVSGHAFYNQASEIVELQRDASYAMNRISYSIKVGRAAELESEGHAIKIYRQTDWIRYFLENGDLKCEVEGGQPKVVVQGNVENLGFTLQASKVRIDLALAKDNIQNNFASTVSMRNYGE